jgi:hypothetical protein
MFEGCINLVTGPELLATTLPTYCYREMFLNCEKLSSIKCLATTFGTNSTQYWVDGVASSGTFTKASGVSWNRNVNGIPSSWTVVEV